MEFLWYSTAIFAIWGSSLGGISTPALGLLTPFRLVAALLAVLLLVKSRKSDWNINRKTWFTVVPALAFMLAFSVLSVAWAGDRGRTARAAFNFVYVSLFMLLFFRMVRDKKSLDRLLTALSVNFLAILLIGAYETYSGVYFFADPSVVNVSGMINAYGVYYPVVCFTNPNDYAFTISLTTPLMLYVLDEALKLKPWQRKALKLFVVALSFFNMMNTCSRLGYIVYLAVMLIYLALQIRKSASEIALLAVLSVVVALSLSGALKVEVGSVGFGVNDQPITGIGAQDTSTQIRVQMIEKGLRVAKDTHGLGAGAKNSPVYFARYTDFAKPGGYEITDYHFFYIELLADYGVVPLVFFLLFQAGTFAAAVVALRKKKELRWLALCSLPGVVGFALASANCSSCLFLYIMWIQFAVWSLMASAVWAERFSGLGKLLKSKQ